MDKIFCRSKKVKKELKPYFYDLSSEDIASLEETAGLPAYRIKQIEAWLSRALPLGANSMTDLPEKLRSDLARHFDFSMPEICTRLTSLKDGTEKFALRLRGGDIVEAVVMRYKYGLSLCISCQVGCAMGCGFCASAKAGFAGNLSGGEICAQFLKVREAMGQDIDRVVLMGIGEPLENIDAVMFFIERATSPKGFGISARKISLSTCGLIKEINKLAQRKLPLTLSLSLHAPEQALREKMMPIAKNNPLPELMDSVAAYAAATGRRISFEYAIFKDVNDSKEMALKTAKLLKDTGAPVHLNLIPGNPVPGTGYDAPEEKAIKDFKKTVESYGIPVSVRRSLGRDIDAACGQLRRRLSDNSAKGARIGK